LKFTHNTIRKFTFLAREPALTIESPANSILDTNPDFGRWHHTPFEIYEFVSSGATQNPLDTLQPCNLGRIHILQQILPKRESIRSNERSTVNKVSKFPLPENIIDYSCKVRLFLAKALDYQKRIFKSIALLQYTLILPIKIKFQATGIRRISRTQLLDTGVDYASR